MGNTKFYIFQQNNSGGRFKIDEKRGIGYLVAVEARNAKEANNKASDIGLYFDGFVNGLDCPCCGDRWSRVYEDKYDASNSVGELKERYSRDSYLKKEKDKLKSFIHYYDGKFEEFLFDTKTS